MDYCVILVTAPSEDVAAEIAKTVVEERLAACANIVRGVRSIYRWQGKVEDEAEVLMVIKTRHELFEQLAGRVRRLHPYSVPEVIALPIVEGLADYTRWIGEVTG
jgi:periplasmic divalent cation tolerance protein